MDMRGLSTFIADIRKCQTKEAEQKRIDSELAKIRKKFQNAGGMKGYDRKKYVCKLLYIYMLGYEIDFGHMEAVNLLTSEKYSEKHLGYLACTLFLNEEHELLTLITNSIKMDVNSHNEHAQCLALAAIANVGSKEFAESLGQDVQKLLVAGDTKTNVRKKAALSLLRLYRKYPEILPAEAWSEKVINLLGGRDLGVITSIMGLVLGLVERNPNEYEPAIPKVVRLLTKLVVSREYSNDYIYYGIPTPWLQIKLLKLLSFYPPPSDQTLLSHITQILNRIITGVEKAKGQGAGGNKSVSKNNAIHSVFFEALNLAIKYDNDPELLRISCDILGKYISENKDTNLKYLALEAMSKLALTNEAPQDQIRRHQETILFALKDPDISIRRKALDLIYHLCDKSNAGEIVGELLAYLPVADFGIREELVLKIAILSEKFATDLSWYVDVILNLMSQAGDFVSEDIWFRVVQIVASNEDLQKYAAETVFKAVSSPAAHENTVKVAGYILGEYGWMIAHDPEMDGMNQLNALHSKYYTSSNQTKAMLLNTYIKFYNMFENSEVRSKVTNIFRTFRDNIDAEIQQRANEYFNMAGAIDAELMRTVLANVPAYQKTERTEVESPDVQYEVQTTNEDLNTRGGNRQQTADPFGLGLGLGSDDSSNYQKQQVSPQNSQTNSNQSSNLMDDIFGPSTTTVSNSPMMKSGSTNSPMIHAQNSPDPFATMVPSMGMNAMNTSMGNLNLNSNNFSSTPSVGSGNMSNLAQGAAQRATAIQQSRNTANIGIEDQIKQTNELEAHEEIVNVEEDAASKFKHLCIEDQGVLLEDPRLQIAIKCEYRANLGRIVLLFGNKAQYPLSQVRATVVSIPQLKLQHSVVAPMIAPKNRVQQFISVEMLEPFNEDITLSLFFEYEKQTFRYTLKLPIMVHKFTEPLYTGSPQEFFSKWNSIPKGPLEVQTIFKAAPELSTENIRSILTSGLHLAALDGIDPKPSNFVCAGSVHSSVGKSEVFMRLESNPQTQQFRLTVKSTSAPAGKSIHEAVLKQLQ